MGNQTGKGLSSDKNPKHLKFFEVFCETQDYVKSYRAAGFIARTDDIARQNACRLMRKLDQKFDYRTIMDSIGLTDRHVATRIKDIADDDDGHLAIKGIRLAARCKGWEQPNVSIGVGVEIHITGVQAQAPQDDAIDVTSSALDDLPPDEEQVMD